ncbi:MAG: ethanolamine ammonia-lyase reactivating factor EutA [Anaerolineaceae bacterium]|nr:ethanolamine ammonia-lyase reactivating factor EutA [Anaerolineaceae bacterium]
MTVAREMLSVGIDIGTTTTQVVFSLLSLVDISRAGQISRIEIQDRKVVYQSEIVFTPLIDPETIDVMKVKKIIEGEYASAGVSPAQVETGAVIITGETAKTKNAEEILEAIAGLAGDFVVTVAGPHVESMIAGRGSGAAEYSRRHFTTVTNVDIGGGSANSAIFKQGEMLAAAAMNYGGRILEIGHESGQIKKITRPGQIILDTLGLRYRIGDRPDFDDLRKIAACLADLTIDLIEGTESILAKKLYLTSPSSISGAGKRLMLSGGVALYYYDPIPIHSVFETTIHGDIGPLLGKVLREHPTLRTYQVIRPSEVMRATVLGASSQLVTLSGSTIWTEQDILPIRNIPVIRPGLDGGVLTPALISDAIQDALLRWDIDVAHDSFAIALELDQTLDYPMLVRLAQGISGFAATLPGGRPLIAIIKSDYAQVLGQTMKSMLAERPLLVIDQVGLEEGDFSDIGVPLMDGRVVPLSVKTLIFYN